MYRVQLVDEVVAALEAMPPPLLTAFAELRVALELSPSDLGRPYSPTTLTGLRVAVIGDESTAFVVFGVIERDRVVTVVEVTYL
ncbi:hypothetical protein [Actinomycetospora chiangmaiensis]|uniref:hypothetical protein n=1 Tax=Actinomycetospora chiangmaiensis TaxID=402650 RepID=UPI00036948BA|nr:hypothetical protein [Actinomycetospora chiangmaiensis]